MDYRAIDSVISAKGLAADPAFDDLVISIEPIPSFNGCPLGLYYPDTETVIVPPGANEATLLHELGHRHGHYYLDDLSERYAESFRTKYQGGEVLFHMGSDMQRLPKFGVLYEEGERGAVEVAFAQPLTDDELYGIDYQLSLYNEAPPKLFYGINEAPLVRFEFTKGVDWIVIIGAVLAGTVVAGAGAIGYAIYKTAEATPWVIPVALAGTVALLLLRAASREARVRA